MMRDASADCMLLSTRMRLCLQPLFLSLCLLITHFSRLAEVKGDWHEMESKEASRRKTREARKQHK